MLCWACWGQSCCHHHHESGVLKCCLHCQSLIHCIEPLLHAAVLCCMDCCCWDLPLLVAWIAGRVGQHREKACATMQGTPR